MEITPYEERVSQLRGLTDTTNRKLESALIPYFEDGVIRLVKAYPFEDDMRSASKNNTYRVETITWMTDRVRSIIDETITLTGKKGETISDISVKTGVEIDELLALNSSIDIDTDIYGIIIDTGLTASLNNMVRLGLIKAFIVFVDGHYVPMSHISIKSDIYNDYMIIDYNCFENKACVTDRNRVWVYTYAHATESSDGTTLLMSFDCNGCITSSPEEIKYSLYSKDTGTFVSPLFVDPKTNKGTYGHMFNERIDLPYMNKVKPENIFVFQNGVLIRNAEVTCHNYNIINVRYPEFAPDSRAVVIYKKSVLYTEDNALRVNHAVHKEIAPLFEDFLDDVENSVQRFIDEIYMLDAEKYGLHFIPIRINNVEEGSTPADEIIWYDNEETKKVLYHLISEIFEKDAKNIKDIITGIVDDAYGDNPDKASNYDEWTLRKNLPEMFLHSENENPKYYDDFRTLDESFDFFFYDRKSMHTNMLEAIAYIANYDSDKLESALPRYEVSAITDGKGLRYFVKDGVLKMGRYNWSRRENFVMVFKNGELLPTYSELKYTPLDFIVPIDEFDDDDKFEIVYFLMCNNRVMPVVCNDSIVTSEFWFDKSEVELWDDRTPDGAYSVSGQNQVYRVPFAIQPPLIRHHGKAPEPVPTPSGGGVDMRNGPVYHFDDSDIGYDTFVYITNDKGYDAVVSRINTFVPATKYPDINGLLLDLADNAKNNSFLYGELSLRLHLDDTINIPTYSSYETMPNASGFEIGDSIKFTGESVDSFVQNSYYEVQLVNGVKTWVLANPPTSTVSPIRKLMDSIEQYALLEPSDEPDSGEVTDPDEPPIEEPGTGGGGIGTGSGESGSEEEYDWWLVPDKEMYKLYVTPEDLLFYENDTVWITSRRQFRYQKITVTSEYDTSYTLNNTFRYCTNTSKYMVFVNHRCLPRSYVVVVPRVNNPVGKITFYPNINLRSGDIIEVFYVPDEMTNDFKEEVMKRTETTNSGYIKINKINTMTGISRNSAMVFVNGRKIRYDEVLDISSGIVKVIDPFPSEKSMTLSLEVYRYLYSAHSYTLSQYAPSKLEELIPNKPSKMDDLFDSYTEPCGNEPEVFLNRFTKDSVKNRILQDFIAGDEDAWIAEF